MKNILIHKYSWPAPSPVASLEIEPGPNGVCQARLTAQESAEGADLAALPKLLHKYGFSGAYADVYQGRNILMLPHLKDADSEKLLQALVAANCVSGTPQHEEIPTTKKQPHLDTLKWSGRTGLIGHAALMVNGALQGEWGQVIAGPLGASTAAILANYGNGKSDFDFDTMLKHMDQYFAAEGLDIPPLDLPERKQNILTVANGILAKYPLQIGYTVGTLGALSLMQSGLRRYNLTKGTKASSGIGLFMAGLSSLIGNMAVLFVPEKKKTKAERAEEKKHTLGDTLKNLPSTAGHLLTNPTQIPGAAYNFIAESPLRFNGSLNFVDNIFYFFNAAGLLRTMKHWKADHPAKINELQHELDTLMSHPVNPESAARIVELAGTKGQVGEIAKITKELKLANAPQGKLIPYIALTTALSFGCATFLSAISSKNRSEDNETDASYDRLYAMVAKIVVQMPPDKRDGMLGHIADYLTVQEDIKDGEITSKKLVSEVKQRVALMEQSPWIDKKGTHAAQLSQPQQAAAMAM